MFIAEVLARKGRRAITVLDSARVEDAVRTMADNRIGSVVVLADGGEVRGILTERHVTRRIGRDGIAALWARTGDCLSDRFHACKGSDTVGEALDTMIESDASYLPVLANGRLEGVVSRGDLTGTGLTFDMPRSRSTADAPIALAV